MSVTTAQELMELLPFMSAEDREALDDVLTAGAPIWVPQVGPQSMAAESRADIVFYGGSAGGGKGLALDTPLPTPTGWVLMGDAKPGDVLFDEAGKPCAVTGVSEIHHRQCFRLTFDDGSTLVADDVHRWVTFDAAELSRLTKACPEWRARRRAARPSRAVSEKKSAAFKEAVAAANARRAEAVAVEPPTGTMRDTKAILATLRTEAGRANHAIRVCGMLDLPDADLPVPPYTLGAWLGDGSSRNGQMTGEDLEVWKRIASDGFEVRHYEWDRLAHNIIGLKAKLREAGVLENKHIPGIYLRASAAQRMDLLRGLMDTDGHAALDGGCEFDGMNQALVRGVHELVLSLGIKATLQQGVAKLNGRVIGPKWRVKFTTALPVFALPRKLARLRPAPRRTGSFRYVVSCDPVATVPTRCLSVDSPSRQYLAGRSLIPTHNTDLLCGLGVTQHHQSIIFRREGVQLVGIEERLTQILGSRAGYNSTDGMWRLPAMTGLADGRTLELGSVKEPGDWIKYQGRPHDFIGFDEITHFLELQVRTLLGWLRTSRAGQRTRVVMAGNPPTDSDGEWVIRFFAPWLDPEHPNPAKPGELRFFVTDADGKDLEVASSAPVKVGGRWRNPMSRTFIPSRVEDNLFLMANGYADVLDSLPEPLRSQMRDGNFGAGRQDHEWQAIPTKWIKAAQARWRPRDPADKGPMTACGMDVARGGNDKTSLAKRHSLWFDEMVAVPGSLTHDGPTGAALLVQHVRDGATIPIDSIGVGASVLDFAKSLGMNVHAVVASEGTLAKDKTGNFRFRNLRALMYWRVREALDPTNPDQISLPPDHDLFADLAAVRYKVVTMGKLAALQMRSKDEIREELGRSPDKGDAVAMTFLDNLPPPGPRADAKKFRALRGY